LLPHPREKTLVIAKLFTRQRIIQGQEIREPTWLALILTAAGLLTLLAGLGAAIFVLLYPFGQPWEIGVAALAVFGWCVLAWRAWRRRAPRGLQGTTAHVTGRHRWLQGIRTGGRVLAAGVLAAWLLLIGWAEWGPGGPPPAPKADPDTVRVVTWNILHGAEHGPPWEQADWNRRKHALQTAVRQAAPDILGVQEARPEQVAFLEQVLPGHDRVGVGRDDGRSAGEHAAIWFNRDRFELLDQGTFWLEPPLDAARPQGIWPRRICTWARLRDRPTGQVLRVYNVHSYLTEPARVRAAQVIRERIAAGDPSDAIVLLGDFNAAPNAPSRRLFTGAGLVDAAKLAGQHPEALTYHYHGLPVRCLDGVLLGPGWRVPQHRILNVKPGGTFPSDHFGMLADLTLARS
jgi:endonuclease/exonuclease/phosphatase family metal-dependent hydrolase